MTASMQAGGCLLGTAACVRALLWWQAWLYVCTLQAYSKLTVLNDDCVFGVHLARVQLVLCWRRLMCLFCTAESACMSWMYCC
jgi:hypothetical protein